MQAFFADLGRPQGLAFDGRGILYVVAYYRGLAGIVRITPEGEATHVVSGVSLVGLALDAHSHLLVASTSAVYRLNIEALAGSQP